MSQVLEKVLEAITGHELAKKGDTVLAAVSGGPDSACLLHVLFSLREKLGIKLYAIHINHLLRGAESDADERYVEELCESLGVPLRSVRVDIRELSRRRRLSLEEAGREARYGEFGKYAEEIGAAAVAVAHNRNDQAETVLMHIMRGAGLAGLAGMEYRRGGIIRPLLDTGRDEIVGYCREQRLEPRTDSSNLMDEFTRNKVRLKLIPYIDASFDTDIAASLCRLSRLAGRDDDCLEEYAGRELEACLEESGAGFVYLKLDMLRRLHAAILGRVLRLALLKLKGSLKGIESKHVEILADLISKGLTGPVVHLPGGVRAGISYGVLRIYLYGGETPAVSFNRKIAVPGQTAVEELGVILKAEVLDKPSEVDKYGRLEYNSMVQLFDYELLKKGINIRNRAAGDVFRPYGSGGTKKLKEYFIDSKIPRDLRRIIPIVASGSEVVWVAGYKTSDKFKVSENTKNVLKLEILKNKPAAGG